jgi:hypothetical protein
MSDCPSLSTCPFFNDKMKDMPATAAVIKRNYCQDDNSKCARFLVAKTLGKEKVPSDLYPVNLDKANIIIKENS